MSKPVFTLSQVINQINGNSPWSSNQIGYAFASSIPAGGFPGGESSGLSQFTSEQRTATRLAVSLWEDVANINFVEVAESQADTLFVNYTGAGQAYAYFPPYGDVFINPNQASNFALDAGGYGLLTLIHEIGHSLGLDHPGDYNADRGAVLSYRNQAEYYQDSYQYTTMSYWTADNTGAYHANRYPSSPLLHDIATIQAIYGANNTTRTGNTTYGFNSTADRSVFDFSTNTAPVVALWDAGGTDTLDLSGYSQSARIDLNEGAFSDAGGLTQNIAIAFGTTIENAIGGSGNDNITGQSAANTLNGGAGSDVLNGGTGNDTLVGGSGTDTAVFSGNMTDYSLADLGNSQYQITGADGTDTLNSIEYLQFGSGGSFTLEQVIQSIGGGTIVTPTDPTTPTTPTDPTTPSTSGDAGNTLATASSQTLDINLSGTVGTSGDTDDYFAFTAPSSGQVQISLSGLSDDIDLYLYDAAGNTLDSSLNAGSSSESINYQLEANNQYYIRVTPFLSSSSSYSLTATIGSSDASDTRLGASLLSLPATVSQSVGTSGDDYDYFQIQPDSSGELHLSLSGLSDDIDLYLYDATGSRLSRSILAGSSAEDIYANVTAGSTYYVGILPYLTASSDYQFNATLTSTNTGTGSSDDNDTTTTAQQISLPSTVSQSVGFDNDEDDYYVFTPESSGSVTVSLQGLSSDIDLSLLDTSGNTLERSYNSGDSSESLTYYVNQGENYYIHVFPWLSNESVYQLVTEFSSDQTAVDAGDSFAAATSLTIGTDVIQGVGGTDSADFYQFTANSSGDLSINVTGLSADVDLYLYNSQQTEVGSSFIGGTSDENIEATVTTGESYYIRIIPWQSEETTYTLSTNITATTTPDLVTFDTGGSVRVEYNGTYQDEIVSYNESTGVVTISGSAGTGEFNNLDRIQFSDGTLVVGRGDSAFEIYRLYEAAFNRTPDLDGLSYWINDADNGSNLYDIANSFRQSAEYTTVYGENATNQAIIEKFYNNVLDRAGEAEGVAYWVEQMEQGLTVHGVLTSFSNSAENITNVEANIDDGIWYV